MADPVWARIGTKFYIRRGYWRQSALGADQPSDEIELFARTFRFTYFED
jgi:hypothetical protein